MNENRIPASFFIVLGAVIIMFSLRIDYPPALGDPGPMLLPIATGVGMVVLALLLMFSPVKQGETQAAENTDSPRSSKGAVLRVVVVGILLGLYYLSFERIGFTVATTIFSALAILVLGKPTPGAIVRVLVFSVAFSLAIGAIFVHALGVALPGVLL